MTKELVLFYVFLPTGTLYIRWDQFIIVHVILPIPYNYVPSKFMLVFKRLHLDILDNVTLFTLRVVLGYHPTRLKTIQTILESKFFKFNPKRNRNIFVPTVCELSKQTLSQLICHCFGHVSITRLRRMAIKGLMEGLPTNLPDLEQPCHICLLTKATKIPRGTPFMYQNLPLDSCSKWILSFSMLKASVDLPRLFVYMLCSFIHLWIFIQKQTYTS